VWPQSSHSNCSAFGTAVVARSRWPASKRHFGQRVHIAGAPFAPLGDESLMAL